MQDKFKIGDLVWHPKNSSEGIIVGFPTDINLWNKVYVQFPKHHSSGCMSFRVEIVNINDLNFANDVKVEPKTSEYCEVYVEGEPTYPISSFSSMKDGLAFARNERRAYKIICNIGTQTLIFGRIDGVSIRDNEWFLLETLDKIEDMDWLADWHERQRNISNRA